MEKNTPPKFDSFKEFYECHVQLIKKNNPGFLRLDGRTAGGSRSPNAFFWHNEQLWKVDEDTRIRKLEKAYEILMEGREPFSITSTIENKGKCLVINGEPIKPRHFYVYLVQGS